jgi:nitrate/nitrite transport system permease protein
MSATIELVEPDLAPPATSRPALRGRPPSPPPARRATRAVASVLWAGVGFGVLVGLWAAISAWKPQIPGPAPTFTEMRNLLEDPFRDGLGNDKGIFIQLRGSLGRVFKGFALAALIGVPLGLLVGANRYAFKAANPVIQLLRPVSPLAWFPIWLTMFRDAPQAAMWTIFLTGLWPIVLNTAAGASSVPVDQRNVAAVFRFGRLSYLRHVLVPHSLPSVVTGLRLSMGIAWMVIVAVEMLSGGVGIGFFVWDSYNALNLAKVICAIGMIGTVGLVLDALFLKLGKAVEV